MNKLALTTAGAALAAVALTAVPALASSSSAAAGSTTGATTASTSTTGARALSSAPVTRGVDSRDPAVTYTQAGSTVTARAGGKPVATITLHSLSRRGTDGWLTLDVRPAQPFTLYARDVVWEDQQGGEHAPLSAQRVFSVSGTTRHITLAYRHISAGATVWVPGNDVAGVWGVG